MKLGGCDALRRENTTFAVKNSFDVVFRNTAFIENGGASNKDIVYVRKEYTNLGRQNTASSEERNRGNLRQNLRQKL